MNYTVFPDCIPILSQLQIGSRPSQYFYFIMRCRKVCGRFCFAAPNYSTCWFVCDSNNSGSLQFTTSSFNASQGWVLKRVTAEPFNCTIIRGIYCNNRYVVFLRINVDIETFICDRITIPSCHYYIDVERFLKIQHGIFSSVFHDVRNSFRFEWTDFCDFNSRAN